MIFRVLVVLNLTLCKLKDYFYSAVRQREQVDIDVL